MTKTEMYDNKWCITCQQLSFRCKWYQLINYFTRDTNQRHFEWLPALTDQYRVEINTQRAAIFLEIFMDIFTDVVRSLKIYLIKWKCEEICKNYYLTLYSAMCLPMVQSHYLNQWWILINWTIQNKLHWNLNRNLSIFIKENAFGNISKNVCYMVHASAC